MAIRDLIGVTGVLSPENQILSNNFPLLDPSIWIVTGLVCSDSTVDLFKTFVSKLSFFIYAVYRTNHLSLALYTEAFSSHENDLGLLTIAVLVSL